MATDTKNESASDSVSPTAIVGGQTPGVRKLHFKKSNQKKWLVGAAVVIVIILGWWLATNYSGNTAFKVNGKRYSQDEVKNLAAYQTNVQHVPYSIAAKKVYNTVRYQTAAQSVHITVTPAEEKRYGINTDAATQKKYKSWMDIVAYDNAVAAKLPQATNNGKEGYAYIFWFGDAVQPSYGTPAPGYGNPQVYQADQKYASQQANYYHDQLQNKKMTPSQVLTAVKKNPKLAPYGVPASNQSRQFGTDTYQSWQNQLSNSAIIQYASSVSSDNTLSSIRTDTTATKLGVDPGKFVNAYYYIVLVQKAHVANITQQFHQAQATMKAKYYGV